MKQFQKIFITGGGGYVGAVLIPRLLDLGYEVTTIDLMIYGEELLPDHPNLTKVKGDIRDRELMKKIIPGNNVVIHLACISNDPSFELNPGLGKAINFDAFEPMVQIAIGSGVQRFIYASSASVYGIKDIPNVTEDMHLEPLTDYSKFKAMCEKVLHNYRSDDFTITIIRPATLCGYSPRLRLDLTVNVLTNHAVNKGRITVFGGQQKRPNLHIKDMVRLYEKLLELPIEKIAGKVYNVGYENLKVAEIAEMVKSGLGGNIDIVTTPSDDHRSYHICSTKIKEELGFIPTYSIENAVYDLKAAFDEGLVPESMVNSRYFNVKRMNEIKLQ